MAKPQLTVTAPDGSTHSRRTARPYTHAVVARADLPARLQAAELRADKATAKMTALRALVDEHGTDVKGWILDVNADCKVTAERFPVQSWHHTLGEQLENAREDLAAAEQDIELAQDALDRNAPTWCAVSWHQGEKNAAKGLEAAQANLSWRRQDRVLLVPVNA